MRLDRDIYLSFHFYNVLQIRAMLRIRNRVNILNNELQQKVRESKKYVDLAIVLFKINEKDLKDVLVRGDKRGQF